MIEISDASAQSRVHKGFDLSMRVKGFPVRFRSQK